MKLKLNFCSVILYERLFRWYTHTLRVSKCNDGNFIHFKLSSFAVCFFVLFFFFCLVVFFSFSISFSIHFACYLCQVNFPLKYSFEWKIIEFRLEHPLLLCFHLKLIRSLQQSFSHQFFLSFARSFVRFENEVIAAQSFSIFQWDWISLAWLRLAFFSMFFSRH